jgi:hypothetical protein
VASQPAQRPADAFIDPQGYRAFIDAAEVDFRSGRTHSLQRGGCRPSTER